MIKRIIAVSVLGVSALGMVAANATTPGLYAEGQIGYANTGKHFVKPLVPGKIASKYKGGLAGRLAIGYQFNPNWAVEMGYLQLAQQKGDVKSANQSVTLNQHAFDVVGKGIIPVTSKFDVYAKAGMAYLVNNLKGNEVGGKSNVKPMAKHSWAPEAAIGATYNITSNVFIDTAFTHIQPIGKHKPNNINMATVGLGFTFG